MGKEEFILTQGTGMNIPVFVGLSGYLPQVLLYKEILAIFAMLWFLRTSLSTVS